MDSVKFESPSFGYHESQHNEHPQTPLKSQYNLQKSQHSTKDKDKDKDKDKSNSLKLERCYSFSQKNDIVVQEEEQDACGRVINKKFKKSVWTKEEDQLLKRKVQENGPTQWAEIAKYLPKRTGKQCRERWHNHLRDGVTKQAWEIQQYWILALCVRAFGRKWSIISQHIPGRSDNTIKNQWNCKMKPYRMQFEHKIERLMQTPQNWYLLSSRQRKLLKIIDQNNKNQDSMDENRTKNVNKNIDIISKYCQMLDAGLLVYMRTKRRLELARIYGKEGVNNPEKQEWLEQEEQSEKIQIGEQEYEESQVSQQSRHHGDLSAAISGGDCFIQDSDLCTPIRSKALF